MTAAVPLIAESLNLAITEHWRDVAHLANLPDWAFEARSRGRDADAAEYDDAYSACLDALAVALHARLQEQGALT